jgi:hypothetical protein
MAPSAVLHKNEKKGPSSVEPLFANQLDLIKIFRLPIKRRRGEFSIKLNLSRGALWLGGTDGLYID